MITWLIFPEQDAKSTTRWQEASNQMRWARQGRQNFGLWIRLPMPAI
jgi:hypothetical protein